MRPDRKSNRCRAATWLVSKCLLGLLLIGGSSASAAEEIPVGRVAGVLGQNYVLREGDKINVTKGMDIFRADQLVTGSNSVVRITFADGSTIMASKDSSFKIEEYQTRAAGRKIGLDSVMGLVRGKIRVFIKPRDGGHNAVVKSKNAVMGVRGTDFVVSQDPASSQKGATKLVVIEGAVAFSPIDEEGNPLAAANEKRTQQVVVLAGQESRIVGQEIPSAPVRATPASVAEVKQDEGVLAAAAPLSDAEITSKLVLPPPVQQQQQLIGEAGAKGDMLLGVQAAPQTFSLPSGRTVVVIPRDPALVSEIGLACDGASLARLRNAARLFDEETVPLATQLVGCDEFQDEAFLWLFLHHRARGETRRAETLTRSYQPPARVLDLVTPREFDLKLFRNKQVNEILKRASATKGKARDRQLVLLAARAAVISGDLDRALSLYDEALATTTLTQSNWLRIERIYVVLLKGDFAVAEGQLEQLAAAELDVNEQKSVIYATEAARRKQSGRLPKDVFVRGFASARDHSDGYGQNELGLAWRGELFSLSSGLGGVRIANSDRGGSSDFGYARLGLGARTAFSTGATASIEADFYGSDEPIAAARLSGVYPVFEVAEVSLHVASEPQFTEFVSLSDQLDDSILRLGWGIAAFEAVRYTGEFSSYDDGESALDNRLQGIIPVHRTGLATRRLDVTTELRHFSASAGSQTRYAPKSALSVLGGVDWRWTIGRSFQVAFGTSFGYLSRQAFGGVVEDAAAVVGEQAGRRVLPWVERSNIASALVGKGAAGVVWQWMPSLGVGLSIDAAFESALDEVQKPTGTANTADNNPRASDETRNKSDVTALLQLKWDYNKP